MIHVTCRLTAKNRDQLRNHTLGNRVWQRFSNWGRRTKGGPRRVPTGSARGFRKVVIVCTVYNNLRPICFQICTHKSVSHSVSVHCVEVLPWFGTTGFLLMSLSSAACAGVITSQILNLMQRTSFWVLPITVVSNAQNFRVTELRKFSFGRNLCQLFGWACLLNIRCCPTRQWTFCYRLRQHICVKQRFPHLQIWRRSTDPDLSLKVTCVYVYPTLRQELTVCAKRSKHIHHTNTVCLPFNAL